MSVHFWVVAALVVVGLNFLNWLWDNLQGPVGRKLRGNFQFSPDAGMWRREIGRDRHGPLLDASTHDELRGKAFHTLKDRRFMIAVYSAICGFGLLFYFSFSFAGSSAFTAMFFIFYELLAFFCVFLLLRELFEEARYQLGDQHMAGPRVIQPMPLPPPGPETLDGANTHGDAGPAAPPDIGTTLGGHRKEPPNIWED